MATQRERVFVARGQVANAKHAHQGFEFVGQGHHQTDAVARQRITGKAGFVVVFNGLGHIVAQAIVAGVVAAHDALQLGELAHHVGQQVGLGQPGSGVDGLDEGRAAQGRVALREQLGHAERNGAHALGALALRAKFVVIDDFAQAFDTRGQCFFAVLVEEEFGIGQARAHDPLVATDHRAGVVGADVADHQELVGQLARGVEQGEVFLVGLHGQDEALLRHVEELLLEFADQHVGTLDQGSDFVEQGCVVNGAHTPAHLRRSGLELACNLGTTLDKAGDDCAVLRQGGGVMVGVLKHHRGHLGFKAVALGAVASSQAERFDGHHGAAMQGDQAVGGAHKFDAAPAGQFAVGLELVAHDFGNGQFGNGFVQGFLQALGQAGTVGHAVVEEFAVRRTLELRHGFGACANGLQFFEQGGGGVALGIQADRHWHELFWFRHIYRFSSHSRNPYSQSAW